MPRVLLSASFPFGERGDKEARPYDVSQIADACVYVAQALFRAEATIVFGAHPTISPLILTVASQRPPAQRVAIYQSRWFKAAIPPETQLLQEMGFGYIEWTPRGRTRALSLERMRKAMMQNLDAAVFIGGMSGIHDEFALAQDAGVRCHVVTGPGGAARRLELGEADECYDGARYPEIAARIAGTLD